MIEKIKRVFSVTKQFNGVINLPVGGLESLVDHYEGKPGANVPMQVVVIYNVEQLAMEIAKHLKNGADDGGQRDDETNDSPIPP